MTHKDDSKADTRRKLLRGSVAAPLLMTLRPTTSAAASFTCFDKTESPSQAPLVTDLETTDSMVRVRRDIYEVIVTGQAAEGSIQGKHKAFMRVSKWVRESDNVEVATVGDSGLMISGPYSDYYLAYVNSSGQVVSAAPEAQGTDTKAVSLMCWASLTTG